MPSQIDNGTVQRVHIETISVNDVKEGDNLYLHDSPDKLVSVFHVDTDIIRVEDSENSYLFALTPDGQDLLGALASGMQSVDPEGGVDTEGEEGEDKVADFALISGTVNILKRTASAAVDVGSEGARAVGRGAIKAGGVIIDAGSAVKEKTYDKVFNKNDDIDNPNSKSITTDKLEPGDILLKRLHSDDKTSSAINLAQLSLNGLRGYKDSHKLTHAMIYIGNRRVIEAVDKGIGISPLRDHSSFNGCNYNEYDFYVLRCRDSQIRQIAVQMAKELLPDESANNLNIFEESTPVKVEYDHKNLYLTIGYKAIGSVASLGGVSGGDKLIDLARSAVADSTSKFSSDLKNNRSPKLFCSELVAYCYHAAADAKGRKRYFQGWQQGILSPEHLYVFGRRDGENFEYVGRLPAHAS
ncbi:hypothetical protein [Niveispirillum sp. BGYR6]|uniref:hypothetical protein n=1 Tax=Niveispirillum sp. BGYR6 TaxID=2971249 RepID=UPI0022B98988|nr:hypothetical protein [Niveispirillum sp. BGYR6]MDG5496390.1 hypothetical protein [Niveispirillum sp. BGYR6]